MRTPTRLRPFCCALAFTTTVQLAPLPLPAQEPAAEQPAPDPGDIEAKLQQAKDLINIARFDDAIAILKPALEQAKSLLDLLREVYLLLIRSYVYNGDTIRSANPSSADLNYKEAKSLIREMLLVREFRHTQPDPDAGAQVGRLFEEVRDEIFGTFRILELDPVEAIATLDGDTLRALPGETALGDVDIRAGKHQLVIRAQGYNDVVEDIDIKAGTTVERPAYKLGKRRSKIWYVGGGLAAVAGTVVAIATRGGDETPPPEPLPEPPGPPPR